MIGSHLFASGESLHVSLPAEPLLHVAGIPFTNAMFVGVFSYAIVLGLLFRVAHNIRAGRVTRLTTAVQWMFEGLLSTIEDVVGSKQRARQIAPLAVTMFILILTGYYLGLLPVVGAVRWHGTELFRGGITDLNFTFSLAIVSMLAVQVFAIREHGILGNARRYFVNPLKDPAHSFEGILELVAEFSRGIALSFRLFGNVFAGEVLIAVVAFLAQWFTPLAQPVFLAFELFIGLIQSYVFFMLTVVFIALGTAKHDSGEHTAAADTAGLAPAGGTKSS
ncbi:ATP synthase subunit A [Candidatus Saccharibacteria bacterium]|nr:MAG: ATP synthase subunit A [Candidatus Saccharibacteria bacterium]